MLGVYIRFCLRFGTRCFLFNLFHVHFPCLTQFRFLIIDMSSKIPEMLTSSWGDISEYIEMSCCLCSKVSHVSSIFQILFTKYHMMPNLSSLVISVVVKWTDAAVGTKSASWRPFFSCVYDVFVSYMCVVLRTWFMYTNCALLCFVRLFYPLHIWIPPDWIISCLNFYSISTTITPRATPTDFRYLCAVIHGNASGMPNWIWSNFEHFVNKTYIKTKWGIHHVITFFTSCGISFFLMAFAIMRWHSNGKHFTLKAHITESHDQRQLKQCMKGNIIK